ncbi:hypothetical protein JOD01_001101, partial [Brevibacillus fulvus]|nr:hypothetical protein [Brevibacillus fulvus]
SGVFGLVTEKLLQVGVKSFFYAQKTLLLKGLDLCKWLIYTKGFRAIDQTIREMFKF